MNNLLASGGVHFQAIIALTVLGILALPVLGILSIIAKRTGKAIEVARTVSIAMLLCVPIPLIIGIVGTFSGVQSMETAVAVAPSELQNSLRASGLSVAMLPKMAGLCSSMTCMLPAALLCVFLVKKQT